MGKVTVEPKGLVFDAPSDRSLMDAAVAAGIRWPTVCGGKAICLTCYVVVRDGADRLSPQSTKEHDALDKVRRRHPSETVRLACQTRVEGDVTVFCRGARPAS